MLQLAGKAEARWSSCYCSNGQSTHKSAYKSTPSALQTEWYRLIDTVYRFQHLGFKGPFLFALFIGKINAIALISGDRLERGH